MVVLGVVDDGGAGVLYSAYFFANWLLFILALFFCGCGGCDISIHIVC